MDYMEKYGLFPGNVVIGTFRRARNLVGMLVLLLGNPLVAQPDVPLLAINQDTSSQNNLNQNQSRPDGGVLGRLFFTPPPAT